MHRTRCVLALLATLGAQTAAAQQPSLVGTWEWTRKKNNCVEHYTFRDNGTASIRSGDDRIESTFALAWAPEPNGRYKLTLKPVTDSAGPGCADTPEQAAARRGVVYVLFGGSRETMILCTSLEGADCIGPLRRSAP